MNLDAFYAAFSSVAQAINNIGQSLTTLADIATGTPTVATTTTVSTMPVLHVDPYPSGADPYTGSSGNVANATATATIVSSGALRAYMHGFDVSASGATAAGVVTITVTGVNSGTMSYTLVVPAGITTACERLSLRFSPPLKSSGAGVSIAVVVPALGAGNTNSTAVAYGYRI